MLLAVRDAASRRTDVILSSRARWLTMSKIETIIGDRHSDSGNRGWDYLVTGNYPAEDAGDITGYPPFGRSVTFTETNGSLVPTVNGGNMIVNVTVTWTDWTGASRSMAVETVLTEYDP